MLSCVQGFANILSDEVKTLGIAAEVIDMKDYDPDDQLADEVRKGERRVQSYCLWSNALYIHFKETALVNKSFLLFLLVSSFIWNHCPPYVCYLSLLSAPTSQCACSWWPPTLTERQQKMQSGFVSGWRRRPLTSDMGKPTWKASDMLCLDWATLSMLDTTIQ